MTLASRLSFSSQAAHTPPPKTLVWRRQPSATTISPVISVPADVIFV
jgi:hypothetical protein